MLLNGSTTWSLSPLWVDFCRPARSPPPRATFNFFRCLHLDFTFSFHQRMKGCQIAFLTVIYWSPQSSGTACHLLLLCLIPGRMEYLGRPSQLQMEGGNILNTDAVDPGSSLEIIFLFSIRGKTCSPVDGSNGHLGPSRVWQRRWRGWVCIA